ncbi:uncharacterized protein Z518_04627 [Rhinocladiella mackenziei CBS 650.93]|uniref:Methyltransferase domain-containing protein n=1 Tax=Rhinocladiella mackenziei CBS 650.93 TaxID=1442369 RepID=A0A0D2IU01_9EURO|nr:uncharacterized protein Z518_04627 [Rhinocladiella mackenziei CBS 650.93]KIX06651.1 hypothetical protein Z518_04627 [Rhinocladiella mackenziei CBS 650.93]
MAQGQNTSSLPNASNSLPAMYSLAEKITSPFGKRLLEQAKMNLVPEDTSLRVLDCACGIGIISAHLMDMLAHGARKNMALTCLDASEPQIAYLRQRVAEEGWENVTVVLEDAQVGALASISASIPLSSGREMPNFPSPPKDTKLPSASLSHIFINIGPTFFRSPSAAMKECRRLLQRGGVVGVSVWKGVGWREDMEAAIQSLDDELPFPTLEQLLRIHTSELGWENTEALKKTMQKDGFVDVQVTEMAEKSILADVEEYMLMHSAVMGLIMRFWTLEQRESWETKASESIEKYMRLKYGSRPIPWTWEALLATAQTPA